jgi:hypothetical protein
MRTSSEATRYIENTASKSMCQYAKLGLISSAQAYSEEIHGRRLGCVNSREGHIRKTKAKSTDDQQQIM